MKLTNILLIIVVLGIAYVGITNTIIIRQNKENCTKIIKSMPSEAPDYFNQFEEVKDKIDDVDRNVQDCDYDVTHRAITVTTE